MTRYGRSASKATAEAASTPAGTEKLKSFIDSIPKIVRTQSLAFPVGQHTLEVTLPGRGFNRIVTFQVGDRPANLHVMVNRDEVEVNVTYGDEAYL